MNRRSGSTLIEVLIAIFVAALGLIALLALFPLGALSMASAIKDSRCAQSAGNAQSIFKSMNIANDPGLFVPADPFAKGNNPPVIPVGTLAWPDLSTLVNYEGPSYPVYVDPLGKTLPGGTLTLGAYPVGPALSPGIPRRRVTFASSTAQYMRWFTLLDDISFLPNGTPAGPPDPVSGKTIVERSTKFSWTYLLRRPSFNYPSIVDVTVVVYSDRSSATLSENSYYVDFTQGSMTVTIYLNQLQSTGQEKPRIKTGSWILDATVVKINPALLPPVQPDPHGFFYRVVNVTEGTGVIGGVAVPTLVLELQSPIRRQSGPTPAPQQATGGQGVLVVLDGVVEVFEKGPQ